jgi:hypothetical protein
LIVITKKLARLRLRPRPAAIVIYYTLIVKATVIRIVNYDHNTFIVQATEQTSAPKDIKP